jgi:hypothetical protein
MIKFINWFLNMPRFHLALLLVFIVRCQQNTSKNIS